MSTCSSSRSLSFVGPIKVLLQPGVRQKCQQTFFQEGKEYCRYNSLSKIILILSESCVKRYDSSINGSEGDQKFFLHRFYLLAIVTQEQKNRCLVTRKRRKEVFWCFATVDEISSVKLLISFR